MSVSAEYWTVAQVAERFAVNRNKVLVWIGNGQLSAVDVSAAKGERPRWRIHIDEIERFELERRSMPPEPKPTRRRHRSEGVTKFY